MRRVFLTVYVVLLAVSAFGQDCDQTVSDGASVLGARSSEVAAAAKSILDQGGDVRVITVSDLSGTLDSYVQSKKTMCLSWQSVNGGVKNNLVVFAVAPTAHKFGIFFGKEWDAALEGSTNAIKSQFMAPAFRDGDWGRGLINGEIQVGDRIKALNEAALHPAVNQTTVENQATDLSWVGPVIYWILGICAFAFGVWFLYIVKQRMKKNREAIADAQQEAQQGSARVAAKLTAMSDSLAERKALGESIDLKKKVVDATSEEYSRIAGSESYNPNNDGLSVGQYQAMTRYYQRLLDQLILVERGEYRTVAEQRQRYQSSKAVPNPGSQRTPPSSYQSAPVPVPSQPQPSVTHSTTIIDNSSTTFIPIIEEREPYRAPDPEPRHSPRSSSRSDDSSSSSFGGSSSSFSDSSSSFSDSSSSSDFGSGSSDFGGSSSDF